MRTIYKATCILFALGALSGCFPKDQPVKLAPPGNLMTATANIGSNYENVIFYRLMTGEQKKTTSIRAYDLAFETTADGFRVRLNTGKLMFASMLSDSTKLNNVNLDSLQWKTDTPDGAPDSTAIGTWLNISINKSYRDIYIIDRGRLFYSDVNIRYQKIRLLSVSDTEYKIAYADFKSTEWRTFTIPKNPRFDFTYFTFDEGGRTVDFAPPKDEWDLVFTQYLHIFYDQPPPIKYYLVRGALLNRSIKTSGAAVDTLYSRYPAFEAVTVDTVSRFQFSQRANIIGYDWKTFDYQGNYYIRPNNYYLVLDKEGYYYKMKFFNFYDENGQKGYVQFKYQRL